MPLNLAIYVLTGIYQNMETSDMELKKWDGNKPA